LKKHSYYEYYNYVERLVLNINGEGEKLKVKSQIENMLLKIKELSMELQRAKPSEWNSFLDVLLGY